MFQGRDGWEAERSPEDLGTRNKEKGGLVALILLVLLLALLFAGLGFAVHVLWIIAVVFFVLWLIGWAVGRGAAAGSRRQWYGRW